MRVTCYPSYRAGKTSYIHAGQVVDLDLQGGLEEILEREIEEGVKRIVLDLKGMHFLHATLTAGLLSSEIKLRRNGGEFVIAGAPEFVRKMMEKWGVAQRFLWVSSMKDAERLTSMSSAIQQVQSCKEKLEQPDNTLLRIIG